MERECCVCHNTFFAAGLEVTCNICVNEPHETQEFAMTAPQQPEDFEDLLRQIDETQGSALSLFGLQVMEPVPVF